MEKNLKRYIYVYIYIYKIYVYMPCTDVRVVP